MLNWGDFSRGDWFGLAGIVISLLGFVVAIVQIKRTASAANAARDAAYEASKSIRALDSAIEIASVSESIMSIKRAIRNGDWNQIPILIDTVRKPLILAQRNDGFMEDSDREDIQNALTFFSKLEADLVRNDTDKLNKAKEHSTVAIIEISDAIFAIMSKANGSEVRNA